MKRSYSFLAFCILSVPFWLSARPVPSNRDAIIAYISGIPKLEVLPVAAPAPHGAAGGDQDLGIINRRRHLCSTAPMQETDAFSEVVALDPNNGAIWPGALIQGASLASGRITPITLPRTAGTVAVFNLTRTAVANQPDTPAQPMFKRPVPHPSAESMPDIIHSLTSDRGNLAKDQPADMTLSIKEVHSFDQAMLDAGVSASWLSGSAQASLKSAVTQKQHGVIVSFIQRYYSIKFNDPSSVASFFDPRVTLEQVKAVAFPAGRGRADNPPLYISEVKYGRMLLLAISSNDDESSLDTAIRADISIGLGGGSGHLDDSMKKILQNSTIEGLVIGGSAQSGGQLLSSIIGGDIDGLPKFIEDGATYNPNTSPGAPISYVARYLNGDLADTSYTADFSTTGCRDEDVPITQGRISFQVGNDDKDDEMYPFLTIQRGGATLTDASGLHVWDHAGEGGHKWDDHSFHGPFPFPITNLNLADCSGLSAIVGQRSTRGTNPGWRTTMKIEFLVNGSWFTAKPMSDNQDEFIWGDNHPGQSRLSLACPS